jgi:hypothetical protein
MSLSPKEIDETEKKTWLQRKPGLGWIWKVCHGSNDWKGFDLDFEKAKEAADARALQLGRTFLV